LARSYYQQKIKNGYYSPENIPTHKFSDADMRNPNVQATFLDSAPEFQRDQNGNIIKDGSRPVLNTKGEVQSINASMANAADHAVSQLSDQQKLDIGYRKTGEGTHFMRYMPDSMVDDVDAQNQNNRTQEQNFRLVNRNLADRGAQGTEYSFFYHKA